jgi:hypothetical protein
VEPSGAQRRVILGCFLGVAVVAGGGWSRFWSLASVLALSCPLSCPCPCPCPWPRRLPSWPFSRPARSAAGRWTSWVPRVVVRSPRVRERGSLARCRQRCFAGVLMLFGHVVVLALDGLLAWAGGDIPHAQPGVPLRDPTHRERGP